LLISILASLSRPDMFFYRDPEEVEKEAADALAAKIAAAEGSAEVRFTSSFSPFLPACVDLLFFRFS
jgi:hypothetical protein